MRANEIIAHLRLRLKDNNFKDYELSDELFLSYINLFVNDFLREFELNIVHFEKYLESKKELILNFEPLKIYGIFLNDQALTFLSLSLALKKKMNGFFCYEKRAGIIGFNKEVSGNFELFASKTARILSVDDDLILDESFFSLLVLSVEIEILQMQALPENISKLSYLYKVKESKKDEIISALNARRTPNSFKSPFIKV